MFWISKVITPLALVVGIAGTTAFVTADADGNQPPFGGKGGFGPGQPGKGGFGQPGKGFPGKGGDDKKGDKKDDKKVEDKKGDEKKGPAPKADPVVDAWLAVLLTKITDPHDTVRDSARGAIVAVGPPAIPALQKLADGEDPAKAVAARKMIGAIHDHHGGHPGQPGRPGFGGMGGMGGGFPFGPGGMGERKGGPGGERKGGPGREASEIEVAPMPRVANR